MCVFPQNLATHQNHTTLKISPHIGVNSHNMYTVVWENFGVKNFLDALWCPKIKICSTAKYLWSEKSRKRAHECVPEGCYRQQEQETCPIHTAAVHTS